MFLALMEREFGRRYEFDQIVSYDLGKSLDLSKEELDEFMVTAHRTEALMSIEPMEGALDVVTAWSDAGYRVEVVTGRPTATAEVSKMWLEEAAIPHHDLIFVDKYAWNDNVFAGNSAIPLEDLTERSFCLVVEDSASVASRLSGLIEAPVVLIDKPWNRRVSFDTRSESGRVTRCADWSEISQQFGSP